MRRFAAKAALARLAASLIGLLLLAMPALAGDRALIDFLGYSEDGKYFAFEEYGVQDGSGFAYSDIYVVDLVADKWMYGSPFHARADESWDRPLADVRAEAMGKAKDKLKEVGIGRPAEILVLLGDGVPDADGKTMVWRHPLCCGPGQTEDTDFKLTLEIFPAKSGDGCETSYAEGMSVVGYALTVNYADQSVELHRDGEVLPKSRGCALDYRLYAVLRPFEESFHRVAIVSSYPFGFEGPDRRFLAVPID
jgi:predicted secreted protein